MPAPVPVTDHRRQCGAIQCHCRYRPIPTPALSGRDPLLSLREALREGQDVISTLERMQHRLAQTPHLLRLGRLFSQTVLLQVDGDEYYLVFEKGHLSRIIPGPSKKIAYRFAFLTDAAALAEFWRPRPAPGFHDIFGLVKIGRGQITGDILMLVGNLRFFKEFMALARAEEVA